MNPDAETLRLRNALRDLVALSTIPAVWLGRPPAAIAAGLADVMVGSLLLDFAFVRFRDTNGGGHVEAARGDAWKGFLRWLQDYLAVGPLSRKQIVPDVDGAAMPCRGIVIPIGIDGEAGLVAAAGRHARFPDEIDQLLLSVAANQAATAFQSARLIEERYGAEEALRQSEHRWRSLTETLPQLVWTADPDGACDYFSVQWTEYTGIEEHALLGWRWMELLHPDDRDSTRQVWMDSVAGRRPYDVEYRVRGRDGEYGWFKTRGVPIRDSEERIVKWFGTCTDITDQKRADKALRRSEHALRQARDELETKVAQRTAELQRSEAYLAEGQRLSHSGSFAINNVTREIIHSSEEHSRLWGFDPEVGLPSWSEFLARIHPDDRAGELKKYEPCLQQRTDLEGDVRIVLPGGAIRHLHSIAHPVFDASGEVVSFVGTTMDVTERRRAEEERQANLWFFQSVDRINRAIQGTHDLTRMMSDVLEAVLAIFGCDRAWLVYPCDPTAPAWRVSMECTRPEYPGAFPLGRDTPMDADVARVFQMVRTSSDPVRFDPGAEQPVPSELTERFGIQSMIGVAIYPKVDTAYMFGLHQCSYPRVWTAEEERLLQEIGRRLADALTARLTLRNLQESEAKLAEAQRIAHVAYWERDLDTNRSTWSDEAFRIFGLLPEQGTVNFSEVLERVHPDDRALMSQALTAACNGGKRYDLEYRIVRPGGEVRFVHSQGDLIQDASGRPRRLFGTIQDITERKRAEEQLADLAGRLINTQEDERRRIGRELHDHVSQRVAVLAMIADQLRARASLPAAVLRSLDTICHEADEITADIHALSHRLHSSIIDQLGLVPALQRLIAESSARHGLQLEFTHGMLSNHLSSDVALCVFRIAEESLTNVAKHSGARTARVNLSGDNDGLLLSIEDDGVGFQPEMLETKAGLGFVSMRERLRLIRGTIRVQSAPSRGTRIEAWVPTTSA
jgi:PAS domain S-box-containing protein